MKRLLRDERGMALALAMFALVVIGAMVAGAFFAGTQEQRIGDNTRRLAQSFGVAETGIYEHLRGWSTSVYNGRGLYPTDSVVDSAAATSTAPNGRGSYRTTVYKLNSDMYLMTVTGRDTASKSARNAGGGARQSLGVLLRIKPLQVDIEAALTTSRSDKLSGNSSIDGWDETPTGWTNCQAPSGGLAGVRADLGDTVSTGGSSTITGNPPVKIDSTVTDTTFSKFGDVTYNTLAANATITLPAQNFANSIAPTTVSGQCDRTNLYNWGDGMNPTQPCGTYFPIIHITGTGSSTINGIEGQGILLIDGSLAVQGGFQWYGIVIVQGSMSTAGGGSTDAHFWGGVMVHDSVNLGNNSLSGHANLLYSNCAIQTVLNATSITSMLRSRSWMQLF